MHIRANTFFLAVVVGTTLMIVIPILVYSKSLEVIACHLLLPIMIYVCGLVLLLAEHYQAKNTLSCVFIILIHSIMVLLIMNFLVSSTVLQIIETSQWAFCSLFFGTVGLYLSFLAHFLLCTGSGPGRIGRALSGRTDTTDV